MGAVIEGIVTVVILCFIFVMGVLFGAGAVVRNYFAAVGKSIEWTAVRKGVPPSAPGEPAMKSYFFGKGAQDLRKTIEECWGANLKFTQATWATGNAASNSFEGWSHFGEASSGLVFGTIFLVVASLVHAAILALSCGTIYALFTIILVTEKIYLALHGFFTVCPYCHTQTALPIYRCDGRDCGREHRHLMPSSYGILHHTCVCTQRLPATFFLNRGRLLAKCVHCGESLSRAHTEATKLFVPVIGGPSAGKTAFLVWLVEELRWRAALTTRKIEFLRPEEGARYAAQLQGMRRAQMPPKTSSTTPNALNLTLTRNGHLECTLYLYDPAGEAFDGEAELIPNRFLGYCTGVLFLIDPFSIPAVRQHYRIDLEHSDSLRPSKQRPDDLLDRLLFVLEKHFGYDPAQPVPVPIAVILTKIDAFDLETIVGDAALPASLTEQAREEARNALISGQLRSWGMTPLVETMESRFSNKGFFTCSAVGIARSSAGGYTPERIAAPFFWLMRRAGAEPMSFGGAT